MKNGLIGIMIMFILIIGFPGCGPSLSSYELNKYKDKRNRTRPELIADFKQQFEGKCILPDERWCRCKIRDVHKSGFFYGVGMPGGRSVYVYENIFYEFSNRPVIKTLPPVAPKSFEISMEHTRYPPIKTPDKELALKIYGLLDSIYQTY